MPEFWQWVASEGRGLALTLIAGAAGGIVRTVTLGQRGWGAFSLNVLVGAICSFFLGPYMTAFLEPILGGIAPTTSLSGFIAGLCGMTIAGTILDLAHRHFGRRDSTNGRKS